MKKTYILDTNVILDDCEAINSFEENDLIIPLIVIEEIDRHKDRPDEVGANARAFNRQMNQMIKNGADLRDGVETAGGGILKVVTLSDFESIEISFPDELKDYHGGDNKILKICMGLISESKVESPILVTRDIQLRVKAHVLNIPCEDRKKKGIITSFSKLYNGVRYITVDDNIVQSYYETIESKQFYHKLNDLLPEEEVPFHENEYAVLKSKDGRLLDAPLRYTSEDEFPIVVPQPKIYKIKPRNHEQKIALDMMMDPDIKLVTIIGKAGTGKTLSAIAAGLEQVLSNKKRRKYDVLLVSRPVQPLGKDIGYLPGPKEEKMEPWIAPIKDNIRFLLSNPEDNGKKSRESQITLDYLFDRGTIEVEAMTYIRGRSISNAFMVIDEAQNLSAHELKTIITRVGENTKIVLTGDIEQIDNLYVDSLTNGLTVAVDKFKDSHLAGHITMIHGERSELATYAAKIL